MGVMTSLNALSFNASELSAGAANAQDVIGLLSVAQNKADELLAHLKAIVSMLPPGDPNVATINSIITSIS